MTNIEKLIKERDKFLEKREEIQKEIRRLNNAIGQARDREKKRKVVN